MTELELERHIGMMQNIHRLHRLGVLSREERDASMLSKVNVIRSEFNLPKLARFPIGLDEEWLKALFS